MILNIRITTEISVKNNTNNRIISKVRMLIITVKKISNSNMGENNRRDSQGGGKFEGWVFWGGVVGMETCHILSFMR